MEEKYTLFFGSSSPFSQHHPCKYTVDGITYNCAEQYMMHQKAEIFGDKEMSRKILATSDPKMQKKFGRKVQNFDNITWDRKRIEIVKKGNKAKFSQNPDLLKALMETKGTILVECSPRDRFWGIGLGKNNPKAHNKANWRGKNQLGYILTEVRASLLNVEGNSESGDQSTVESATAEKEKVDRGQTVKKQAAKGSTDGEPETKKQRTH